MFSLVCKFNGAVHFTPLSCLPWEMVLYNVLHFVSFSSLTQWNLSTPQKNTQMQIPASSMEARHREGKMILYWARLISFWKPTDIPWKGWLIPDSKRCIQRAHFWHPECTRWHRFFKKFPNHFPILPSQFCAHNKCFCQNCIDAGLHQSYCTSYNSSLDHAAMSRKERWTFISKATCTQTG